MVSRVATTIRSGLIHAGGTRRTDSDAVIPRALRYRPQIETDGIFCSIGRRDARVVAHDRLSARRVAAQLPAVVVGERFFDCGYVFGGNAAQALLIAADGRNLRDDAAQPPVCRAKYDSVAASIAGTPQADAFGVDDIQCFEVADRASPVGYLAPRVDIVARRAFARTESTMVMQQHDESGVGKGFRKRLEGMFFHAGVTMRHRDGWPPAFAGRNEEPAAKLDVAINFKFHVGAFNHFELLRRFAYQAGL